MNEQLREVIFSGIVAVRDRLLLLDEPLRLESGEPSFDTPAHIKDAMINEAKAEAKAEANKIVIQAQATILSEKQAAIADLKSQVAELSIGIAEKVVKKELANDKEQSVLIEQLLKEVTIS